ncbi:hypothetical protein IQ250_18775 [Pseudanabaenaceae cyanobacterium LEGE 13415]|nr:hypothetical protein [Pseudanabaenaceae cyanobacterium LEGE 13415]
METTLIAAVSASLGVIGKSLVDSFFKRRETNYEISKRYSRPILLAASELQARLWEITQRQAPSSNPLFLQANDSEPYSSTYSMTRKHFLVSTVYLFGKYFAYIEILKKKAQFLELRKINNSRSFSVLIKAVERTLAETELRKKSKIRSDRQLFKLQQAYIGEKLMIENGGEMLCMSFAEFYDQFDSVFSKLQDFEDLIEILTRAVSKEQEDFCLTRCCLLGNALVDLINFLDPSNQYVSKMDREKVTVPGLEAYMQ